EVQLEMLELEPELLERGELQMELTRVVTVAFYGDFEFPLGELAVVDVDVAGDLARRRLLADEIRRLHHHGDRDSLHTHGTARDPRDKAEEVGGPLHPEAIGQPSSTLDQRADALALDVVQELASAGGPELVEERGGLLADQLRQPVQVSLEGHVETPLDV